MKNKIAKLHNDFPVFNRINYIHNFFLYTNSSNNGFKNYNRWWNKITRCINSDSKFYKNIFYNSEKQKCFFNDYAVHSKDIAKIIKNGYGNQNILGSVNDFEIKYPENPKIEDIGNANKHLEKDYPDIWDIKVELFENSLQYLKNIENNVEQFKSRVRKIIFQNSEYIEYSNNPLEELLTNKYYYSGIFIVIFKIIQNHYNEKNLEWTPSGNYPNQLLYASYSLSTYTTTNLYRLFSMKLDLKTSNQEDDESKRIIEVLKSDTELKKLVQDYDKESNLFYTNNQKTAFFESIEELNNKIVNQNCTMNRRSKCSKCPHREWI